ncbi:MAG: hypothetical protein V3S32_01550, partial [Acidimicrobiia bacterium]
MPRTSQRQFVGLPIVVGAAVLAVAMTVTVGSGAVFFDTTNNTGNSFTSSSCFDSQPGSVQSGSVTSSANGVVSVAITAVDPTLSFLMFSSRHDSNRPVGSMIRGRLNGAGTAVEFERVTDEAVPVTMTMEWYVVTYTCGITVQRGEVSQATTTIDVPISSVGSTSQAFVTWSKTPVAADGSFGDNDPVLGELTSPTNLQFRVNSATATHIIAWQVIAFDNPSDVGVQTGTTSLLGTATSTTATLASAVDVTKTFVLASYRIAGGGPDIGANMLRAELTNSTTITFTRDISGSPDDITEITWQAVELKEGSSVQRGTQAFAAATGQQNVGITPVDTNKAYAFGSVQAGSGQNVGSSSYAADDIIGVGSFTAELSASQLTLTRDNTAANANVGWFVVHWGSASPAAAVSGTVVPSATEVETVAGGETLIITLTNDTWAPTVGADNSITTDLINGIDSAQAEANGWDAVVKTNMDFNDVTRTSDTVVTINLGAEPTYNITADETVTVTVPATAVAGGGPITAIPTFTISATIVVQILDSWTNGTTHSVSAGTSRLLLVGVYGEDTLVADSVNTVTWGGQTLTKINEVIVGGGFSNIAWLGYLDEAGIAAATGDIIVVTWSGLPPSDTISYSAVTLENVDQTTPVGGSSTGTAVSASTVQPAGGLGVDSGDLAVYITVSGDIQTHTAATGYVEGTEEPVGASGHTSATATKVITATGTEQPIANWTTTNNRLA